MSIAHVHYQGWRGLQNEPAAVWAPCTSSACIEKKDRQVGYYDAAWMFLSILSYIMVAVTGKYYFHDICAPKKPLSTEEHVSNACKFFAKSYDWTAFGVGVGVLVILMVSRVFIPRYRWNTEWRSRLFGLIGTVVELLTVALLGAYLHVHFKSVCWMFIAFALFNMSTMKLIVPDYDFKGPAILAQVAIATSLFPDVKSFPFTLCVILTSLGIYVLKTILDMDWRKVLSPACLEFLNIPVPAQIPPQIPLE